MHRTATRRALLSAAGVGLPVLAMAGYRGLRRGQAASLDVFGDAPAFALTDQRERRVASDELRGKVVIADFIYTSCRDVCPLLSLQMQTLQERLRRSGLLGKKVELLSFTTDPARDTSTVLREWAERYQADHDVWRFLTGPADVLVPLIVQGFLLGVEVLPPPEDAYASLAQGGETIPDYEVMHSTRFVLIDRRWRIRAYYEGRELDFARVERDIKGLLR